MAKEMFKVCAKFVGIDEFKEKTFARFTVVGTGSVVHIPIDRIKGDLNNGAFYLIDVVPRNYEGENYLAFNLRCELTLPRYAEPIA